MAFMAAVSLALYLGRVRGTLANRRRSNLSIDSPESAKRELGFVFEGWDIEWWLQRERDRAAGKEVP